MALWLIEIVIQLLSETSCCSLQINDSADYAYTLNIHTFCFAMFPPVLVVCMRIFLLF